MLKRFLELYLRIWNYSESSTITTQDRPIGRAMVAEECTAKLTQILSLRKYLWKARPLELSRINQMVV